jgi:hypothetical protein
VTMDFLLDGTMDAKSGKGGVGAGGTTVKPNWARRRRRAVPNLVSPMPPATSDLALSTPASTYIDCFHNDSFSSFPNVFRQIYATIIR